MVLNNKLITNRSNFIENFSMEEAFEKMGAICDFFEDNCILSDDEKFLVNSLKHPEQFDLFGKFEFRYAEKKADELKKFFDEGKLSEENKTKIKQMLILLELAKNNGENIPTETFVSNDFFSELNDVTNHIGSIIFKKYNFDKTISKDNKITTKTFINRSANRDNIIKIRVLDEISGQTHYLKLGSGKTLTGIFIQDKVVALLPSADLGEKHMVVRCGIDEYKYLSAEKKEMFEYKVPGNDVICFSATNDGAVFVADDEIELFSDEQISFDEYSQTDGEKSIMVCARENRYVILTEHGRLLTNTGENMENICYVVMRETGAWYAISADGIKYCNGERINENIQANTNFEEVTLGVESNTEMKDEIISRLKECGIDEKGIFDEAVFYGKTDDYVVVETLNEHILCNKKLRVIKYEK